MPRRAFLIVLDSVGIGHAPDAAEFGDEGANTVGHIREAVSNFKVPHLDSCGLTTAEAIAAGRKLPSADPIWSVGSLVEQSAGKDTTTGHWEIAGAPLSEPFATFESFPAALVEACEEAAGVTFIGNYAQSGTVILEELGDQHVATGNPILYTSADSVLQIAAHEEIIPVDRLYEICEACREIADRERIGRVIARPFLGSEGTYERTRNRHDFSMQPPETVLNRLSQ
ncbi:MAG: phosphopentomutase, partial [Verrucomicrobiales bacterium]|nr:phosphopentomutase [Verrucomicrobiales bacterium]